MREGRKEEWKFQLRGLLDPVCRGGAIAEIWDKIPSASPS